MDTTIMLQTAAPNYRRSCEFYDKIGFIKQHEQDNISVYGDQQMSLLVNGQTAARPGFVCYAHEPNEVLKTLTESTLYKSEEYTMTADPNGVVLYIKSKNALPKITEGTLDNKSLCGNNFGTGIETHFFRESISFWSIIGYTSKQEINDQTQYATLEHPDGPAITFYKPGNCPHAFYNPSLTFFNGKQGNPIVIENLRKANINIVEEITLFNEQGIVDNIIISDPGGLHSFIYNDG